MCPRCKSKLWDIPKIRPVKLGTGLGIEEVLLPHREEIRRLARRHGASQILVFGSVRRREATEKSDVDLVVRWKRPVSLLDHAGLRLDIEKVLGRPVDLVNEGGLHWAIQPQVEAEAVPL
jgi:predicted nucleotidyltransferase